MDKRYLLPIKDLDRHLIPHLHPRTILAVSALNTHYNQTLCTQVRQINETKLDFAKKGFFPQGNETLLDFTKVCEKGYIWLLEWIWHPDIVSEIPAKKCLLRTCETNNFDLFVWLINKYEGHYWIFGFVQNLFVNSINHDSNSISEYLLLHHVYKRHLNIHTEGLFARLCRHNKLSMAQMFVMLGEEFNMKIDIHVNDEEAFMSACGNGHIQVAQWLIDLGDNSYGKINIHANNDNAFVSACEYGHISIVHWLIGLEKSYGKINIHSHNDQALLTACKNAHMSVVKYLLKLCMHSHGKINISQQNDDLFWQLCRIDSPDIIEYVLDSLEYDVIKINQGEMLRFLNESNENAHSLRLLHRYVCQEKSAFINLTGIWHGISGLHTSGPHASGPCNCMNFAAASTTLKMKYQTLLPYANHTYKTYLIELAATCDVYLLTPDEQTDSDCEDCQCTIS